MKKFLFLMLSLAVAVSASAGITKSPMSKKIVNHRTKAKTEMSSPFKVNRLVQSKKGFYAPVTTQPEGVLKTYARSGNALYVSGQYITYGEQSGTIDVIFAEDNTVWFKNILYGCADFFGDSYVYGTLSADGSTITVPMGQSIYYSDNYQADVVLAWGTTAVSGTKIVFTCDETVTEAVFSVSDNGSLTLLNSADAPSGSSYPEYEGTGIGCRWTDDGSFGSLIDWNTVYSSGAVSIPQNLSVTPATTSAYVEWDADENAEGYDLRYRPYVDTSNNPIDCDFSLDDYADDLQGWAVYDADGDGFNWGLAYSSDAKDDLCLYSSSWDADSGALTPDNFFISPDVKLQGELRFKLWGSDEQYPEVLQVYALVGDYMYQLFEDSLVTTPTQVEYTVDLSVFEGVVGNIAFRHYSTTDMDALFIDDIFIGDPNAVVVESPEWIYIEPSLDINHCNIEGLTPGTTYEVQVMSFKDNQESDWCDIVEFTTLAEAPDVPDVYMLGGDNQDWDCTNGKKFVYNAEDNLYTLHYTFPAETNYFGFTTRLAENNDDGGWTYIEPYRFGAVAEEGTNFIYYDDLYDGKPLDLTWDAYHSFQIGAGEYDITVDLTEMKVTLKKVVPAHEYEVGDVNHDHDVNIADVTALIDYLLGSGSVCEICANVNGDEGINIADVTALIDKLLSKN